ncbi:MULTISPECIES: S-layer homology domain-containing protein [unclassified Paenibacillus]|uniref:stalk domain-containing protein n=1 Tax=unclassified Paenibacillus TaxID=185978 RepID=UPI001AE52298|nr:MULTISPECIES: S-layer homology domain-containing protein [unclassified Paenibacillus]MBP1155338.1 uncharacterized protein YkwD [Paenibacillus sp. PvP091]MBP1169278.1 uncharacterized protein YkwD [Paenibacillus sp. PvR098]MBP2440305.1 uncharacterized protein YkwD [Paenibacillus sp. PvP052]
MKKLIAIILTAFMVAAGVQGANAQNNLEYIPPSGGWGLGDIQYIAPSTARTYNMEVGGTASLTILAHTDDGGFDVSPLVRIYAEDENIVSVNNAGIVITLTALRVGATNVRAEFGGAATDIPVTVFGNNTLDNQNDVYKNIDTAQLLAKRQTTLHIINHLRSTLGITPLQFNDNLNQAAQAHSNYLEWHGAPTNFHLEIQGDIGFTGGDAGARAIIAGYPSFSDVGEVISPTGDPVDAANGLIDAPLHRTLLLAPQFREVGIGISDTTVITPAVNSKLERSDNKRVYYPYNGQTGVPASWIAAEDPNPLEPFGRPYGDLVGYPISINSGGGVRMSLIEGSLTDSGGNPVDFYMLDDHVHSMAGGKIYLIPKAPLGSGMTYTVRVDYKAENVETGQVSNESNTWSFTTEGYKDKVVELTTPEDQLSADLGKPIKLGRFTAKYESGREEDVTQLVKFKYDPKVMEIKDGYATVTNAKLDEYVFFSAEYEKTTEHVSIHIWEPSEPLIQEELDSPALHEEAGLWDAILSQPVDSAKETSNPFTDINGHWAEATIQWAQQKQVAQGYSDGTFHPGDNVKEAELLAWLFRLYGAEQDNKLKESILYKRSSKAKAGNLPVVSDRWDTKYYLYAWGFHLDFLQGMEREDARLTPINRYMAAQIIAGVDGKHLSKEEAVIYLLDNNYSSGKTAPTLEGYKGDDYLTRAEALQFLRNIKEQGLENLIARPEAPSEVVPSERPPATNLVESGQDDAFGMLMVKGKQIAEEEGLPVLRGGIVYVPIQAIVEAMGDTFTWRDEPYSAIVRKADGTIVHVSSGYSFAFVNGEKVDISSQKSAAQQGTVVAEPYVRNDVLYVPYDFIERALQYPLQINEEANAAIIQVGRY